MNIAGLAVKRKETGRKSDITKHAVAVKAISIIESELCFHLLR